MRQKELLEAPPPLMYTPCNDKQAQRLNQRDEKVRHRLQEEVRNLNERARDLESEARSYRKRANEIANAAYDGRWYDLHGVLCEKDIESLCEVDPSPMEIFD